MPQVHANFDAAFTQGHVFKSSHGDMSVRSEDVTTLVIPSGRIIACDPAFARFADNRVAFERRFSPGRYPLCFCWATIKYKYREEQRIACAMLRIRSEKPARWELATRPGENIAELKGGKFFGYGVDSGMGCFVDADAFQGMSDEDIDARLEPLPSGDWGELVLNPTTGASLVAFSSGWGDGAYPSYWGLDRNGDVAALVTDFGLFVEHMEGETIVQHVVDKLGEKLMNPELLELGFAIRILDGPAPGFGICLEMTGDSCEATLLNGDEKLDSLHCSKRRIGNVWTMVFQCREKLRPEATLILRYVIGLRAL